MKIIKLNELIFEFFFVYAFFLYADITKNLNLKLMKNQEYSKFLDDLYYFFG